MGVVTRALRNVSRRKIRVFLVVIALSFSMAIMMSIPAGILANQEAAEELSATYDTYVVEMEDEINKTLTLIECSLTGGFQPGFRPGFMQFQDQNYLNDTAISNISGIAGVKDVVSFLEKTEGTLQTRDTPRGTFEILMPDYTIVGVPLNASFLENYLVLPTNVVEGRNLEEGDNGAVLLSLDNAEYFGTGVGDQVSILGTYFTVVGIYETADTLGLNRLYLSLSEAQAITDLEGQISRLDVYTEDASMVEAVVSEIGELYPEFYLTTYEERLSELERMTEMYENVLGNADATLSTTAAVAYQEIGIAIVATSLIVLFVMLYTVRERTHEIGVLKAIGFSNRSIMSQLMLEGVIMSLIAGVVGVAIGTLGAPILTSLLLPSANTSPTPGVNPGRQTLIPGMNLSTAVEASLNPQLIVLGFGVALLLGALGTLYPAWRAARTSPMEALRYE